MEWVERALPFVVVAGCVLAFFVARRRGRQIFDAHVADQRSEAASEAVSELRAQLTASNSVTVVAGNSGELSRHDLDVLTAELLRQRSTDDGRNDDHDDELAANRARLLGPTRSSAVGGPIVGPASHLADSADCVRRGPEMI
jgi:hypothetical protein